MERVINGNKQIYRYLPYNKISNMIYTVNYNLVLNIFNSYETLDTSSMVI